ncbi:TolC family protein [Parafilimonas sp.]|uniref:TolC family protein n=1 Tax=Parafilimonas sp. TaxID=1969739 RepID=UPI0039E53CEE
MKKIRTHSACLALMVCLCCFTPSYAQTSSKIAQKEIADTVPQDNVSHSASIQKLLMGTASDTVIEDRLVRLALAQPQYKQTEGQNKILEYQLKKQRSNWLNLLSLSASYNDQTFAKPSNTSTTAYVYPKYFFGVTIPIGLIVGNGTDIKITKASQEIAREQQMELAKSIKAEVLRNYKEYKANEKLLIIQNQVIDDAQISFMQVEQKFKNGTTSLDLYNEASKKYNDEAVKAVELQLKQDLVKVELERLIGMKLEDALK